MGHRSPGAHPEAHAVACVRLRLVGIDVLLPLGTIAMGSLGIAIGFGPTLWVCAVLLVVSTAAVMLVRDVRELRSLSAPANHL